MAEQNAAANNSGKATTLTTPPSPPADAGTLATPLPEGGQPPAEGNSPPPEGDQSPAEGAADSPEGAPEQYGDFALPEGHKLSEEFVEAYGEAAKDANLSQEKAQALIDKVAPALEKQQQAQAEVLRTTWAEESKVDKEFGGKALNENLGVAKAALDKFGTPELKALLNESGLGNHPELIRFFYRAGKAISEDGFVAGGTAAATTPTGPKTFNQMADQLYSKKP